MRIILSRTDSIGDVVLTLPMAGALKKFIPGCTVIFLGSEYTRPVVELCGHVDEFVVWASANGGSRTPPPARPLGGEGSILRQLRADAIIHVFPVKKICFEARAAGIPLRIATAGRWFTWLTCNKLLNIPRKNSDLHEAQLNLALLRGVGIKHEFELEEVRELYGLTPPQAPSLEGEGSRRTLILHPKSKGSAREWGLENFSRLIGLLPADRYRILVTGTREEGALMADFLGQHRDRVDDLTGKLTLPEFISLIGRADALVAASTGPLHIAAALGIRAVGLYAPMRPIFPRRWAPVGRNATFLVVDKNCSDCRKHGDCRCIRAITPEQVMEQIDRSF